jgi:hypothetical protein
MATKTETTNWQSAEKRVKREIEDRGYVVHDANIIFHSNCTNIDLIVYGRNSAKYVHVKSATRRASRDCVVVAGSPWTQAQLDGDSIFNKHPQHFQASVVVIVDSVADGDVSFYIAPPEKIDKLARVVGKEFAQKPKKNGEPRSIGFRKVLLRTTLQRWLEAWDQFGTPVHPPSVLES